MDVKNEITLNKSKKADGLIVKNKSEETDVQNEMVNERKKIDVQSGVSYGPSSKDPEKKQYLEEIKVEEKNLKHKLELLQHADAEKTKLMDALHEYNDIKDATQAVLGQLATFHDVTVSKMHEKYNLLHGD